MRGHHALLFIGDHEKCLAEIPLEHRSGADVEVFAADSLGIDDVRALGVKIASRPVVGDTRRFIISCAQMTLEAQNALLKVFEDPPRTAQFYLIVPRASVLIPTLRSRMQVAFTADAVATPQSARAATFLNASYAARLEQIASLQKSKDSQGMRALIEDIERTVEQKVSSGIAVGYLHDIALVSQYAEIRGASHKMLLEHLALSIPAV